MIDYSKGKIYRLISGSGKQYIGSTARKLMFRIGDHRVGYKLWKEGKRGFITSYILFEEGDVDIVLIENFPCNSKEELHARERYWVETMECVNKQVPTRTHKEWYEQNADRIKEQKKEYYEKNKDKNKEKHNEYQKEYSSQKITCECGREVCRGYLAGHKKTKVHLKSI